MLTFDVPQTSFNFQFFKIIIIISYYCSAVTVTFMTLIELLLIFTTLQVYNLWSPN